MCFGGSQPSVPKPPPVLAPPPAPQPPPRPVAPVAAQKLTIDKQVGVQRKKSKAEESGATRKGTAQLRVPLNIGTSKSGGLNI